MTTQQHIEQGKRKAAAEGREIFVSLLPHSVALDYHFNTFAVETWICQPSGAVRRIPGRSSAANASRREITNNGFWTGD